MKKFTPIIAILILFSFNVFAQSTIVKVHYESGKIKKEITYENGKKNGVETWYYESGLKEVEIPYKDDHINGLAKEYYESGNVKTESTYVNGKKNGIEKWNLFRILRKRNFKI